jgi:hypothetical protein
MASGAQNETQEFKGWESNSDQRIPLKAELHNDNMSEESPEDDELDMESIFSTEEASLKALLERFRQEKGTEQVDLLRVCFGERGVDLNVHIQGDITLSLL